MGPQPHLTKTLVSLGLAALLVSSWHVYEAAALAGASATVHVTGRIGLMGAGATPRNVELCPAGLTAALRDQGHAAAGDPLAAAARSYT